MSRVHEVLRWANRRAVAEEVTRRGYRVSGETLNRWVRDEKEFPAVVERIVFDLFGVGQQEEAPRPEWAEGLVNEIRMNRAVIQAAFAGASPQQIQGVLNRLASELGPPGQPLDATGSATDEATPEPRSALGRS